MNLVAKILLKTFILCNLLLLTTSSNIDLPQAELDDWAHPNNFVCTGNLSELIDDNVEYDNYDINLHNSQNLTFTSTHNNPSTSSEYQFVDSQNQSIENIFTMPEHLPRKQKLNSEIITENIEYQPSKKRRRISGSNQSSFSKENTFNYIGEFTHESSNLFSKSERFFKIEEYRAIFKYYYRSFFIDEFCGRDQLRYLKSIGIYWSEKWDEGNFAKLEVYLKEIYKNMIAKKSVGKTIQNKYQTVKKMLDPERTKGLFYLLVYSFYETGVIALPRSNSTVEKILFNIITHTRLMAYINNDNIRKVMQLKKLKKSKRIYSTMSKSEQTNFYRNNFRYTDFTKVLAGGSFPKKNMFLINVDKVKKEINDNIQLIINKEFGCNPGYKRLCEDYNSKAVEFNKNILFERFPFRIGKYVAKNYLYQDIDYDSIIYGNGYPKNIMSYLMDTNTRYQIVSFTDIKLKSVFILIFISKICLCNVTDLCTLPEYLILIESLQKAYLEYKETNIASDDFQSLLSYFFSLDYLDEDCGKSVNYKKRARSIISAVFPEYKVMFPKFDSEIDKLLISI